MGLDLLVKVFRYAQEGRVLRFFVDVVADSGTTFEQNLFGVRGIDTIDPENIQSILSTNFTGKPDSRTPRKAGVPVR